MKPEIRLTEFSIGGGCGCKIAPDVLAQLLESDETIPLFEDLVIGNSDNDDAAVYDFGDGRGIVSTTDFFTPIVDDPFDFGRIAATNALSDVYAMGALPMMAIAIFGWPTDHIPVPIGQKVIEGGRFVCHKAGVPLAGGHSISSQEPIFGLAVTGSLTLANLKRNSGAKVGDLLFLTKPLGIGILTTAQKRKILKPAHRHLALECMLQLNDVGYKLGKLPGVTAMTDVTGFGLLGHMIELCRASKVATELDMTAVPIIDPSITHYCELGAVPGGSDRNWRSYRESVSGCSKISHRQVLCDPQTSGGLLISVDKKSAQAVVDILSDHNLGHHAFAELIPHQSGEPYVKVLG